MEMAISLKFAQHRGLKHELLGTGDAELIQVCSFAPQGLPLRLTWGNICRIQMQTRFGGAV